MLRPPSATSSLLFQQLLVMVQGLRIRSTAFATPLKPQADQSLQRHAVLIRKNTGLRKQNSARLKKPELSAAPILPGLHHCTWFRSRMVLGVHAAIIAGSILQRYMTGYPLPSILDLSARLNGCRFFSCIDLVKGYHQVPMDPSDIAKTAIITPFGLFEYLFMPFGLTNAAQTFQRLMDRLFGHFPFVFTYLDDHLVASATMEEHLEHLRIFLEILRDNGLTINPSKCSFAVSSVKFFGHMVSESGVVPLPRHVETISGFPRPTDLRQLQQFLGLINF
jgi:hypothetical protein